MYADEVTLRLPDRCDDPGDVIVATDDRGVPRVAVVVPPPGITASAILDAVDGDNVDLDVTTSPDGGVATMVLAAGTEALGATAAGARAAETSVLDECQDDEYHYVHAPSSKIQKVYDSWDWYFNPNSTPSYMTVDKAEMSLKSAATRITQTTNNCGAGDRNPKSAHYLGRRNFGIQVAQDADAFCGAGDDRSVVLFGNVTDSNTLALTCAWSKPTTSTITEDVYEADVRINKNLGTGRQWWFYGYPCSGDYSLTAVMTHEVGHVFGMGHVDEATHGELTMSTKTASCDTSENTLGLGDYDGLYKLYH